MKSNILKCGLIVSAGILAVLGSANANVLFQDTFDGTGALGAGWEEWKAAASGANPGQDGAGNYVFAHTGTGWAEAAIQTTATADIASYDSVKFRFDVTDWSGTAFGVQGAGQTRFVAGEYDTSLGGMHSGAFDGLVLSVDHQSINFGSWPDAAADPRTWLEIQKSDGTGLGTMVVMATNNFTLVMSLTSTSWEFDVEGASYWVSGGSTSGLHGYDVGTWADGASLRVEEYNVAANFGPARIDGISIETIPEPATLGLLGLGGLMAFVVRRLRV